MKPRFLALSIVSAACIFAAAASAVSTQSPADTQTILKELQAIREAQASIQKELTALRALIETRATTGAAPSAARPTAVGRTVGIAGAPFKGRANAPLTLVEFSDFQCPYCARHFSDVMPLIFRDYVDTGKVKYVFRHFPLEHLHPLALKASEAAECANDQQKFWPMHDRLFGKPSLLAPPTLPAHAEALSLDRAAFQQCLATSKHVPKIRRDMAEGGSLGVSGTPAFFIGRTAPGVAAIKVEVFLSGAKSFATFKQAIDRLAGPGGS